MQYRVGEIIREYKLVKHAGEGAFASVYRAEHRLLEQTRAMKIIHPRHITNPDSMQRFKSEAQAIAQLQHPHIVGLHEFWLDDNGAYIVMEWMEKGTLESYATKESTPDIQAVSRILSQIAPALNLVHNKDIVHRDLKPANILFDEFNQAHLADFGLAKWLKQPNSTLSTENSIGTPAYMPPEQADPTSGFEITARADIYSLGIILYEMITGRHPFGECGMIEMILHHLRDPIPLIRDTNHNLPETLDEVIQKATAKNPQERYSNVLELAEAFQVAINPKPAPDFLSKTSNLISSTLSVKAVGDLNARIYKKAGSVLENPRQLVGREEQINDILDLISYNSHILLHGMGGIGKTAIVGSVVARYLKSGGKQVIWIELGRQDEGAFFDAIARVLGQYTSIATANGDERIAIIRDILLDTDALLVIDNVWNEYAVLPIIRAIPYSMPMLMTSRIALSIDGTMLNVNALDGEGAIALLSHHANHNYKDDKNAKYLCSVLGNHPYAIEMAGKRLQVYRYLNPKRLADDIQNAPQNLVVTGKLGIQQQRSVKDLLDESIDELSNELRHLLLMIGGLFSTRASLNLLSRVTEKEMTVLENELAELERMGLLHLNFDEDIPPHYRLHDLTYSYVHTVFNQEQGESRQIVQGVRNFSHDYVQDYDALQFDLMNILGAARSAYHHQDNDSLIDIMYQLVVEANYLTARGISSAAMDLLNAAIDAAKNNEDYESAHYLTGKLGNVFFQITHQYDKAVEAYTNSMNFAERIGNLARQASLTSLVATARFKAGFDKVEDYFKQASLVAAESGDAKTSADIFNHRSFYANEKSKPDFEESLRLSNKAIEIAAENGLTHILFTSIINRGKSEYELGLVEDALNTDLEAYHLAQEHDNHYWLTISSKALAWLYHLLDDKQMAFEHYQSAYVYAQKVGNGELLEAILIQASNSGYELEYAQEAKKG